MSKPLWEGKISNYTERGEFIGKMRDYPAEKQPIVVTIRKYDGKHSHDQRKAFHCLMRELSIQARNVGSGTFLSEEEWKRNIIKALFGMVEHKNIDGTVDLAPRTSSSLKMSEYADLITFTIEWADHHFDSEITLQVKEK